MSARDADVLIVGAGICGLDIARRLTHLGRKTVVLEKSRGVGGRVATRRTERARFDHGAQFYVARPESAAAHAAWDAAGVVRPWWTEDGLTRYATPGGLTAVAKAFAHGLDVRLGHKVTRIERSAGAWVAHGDDGFAIVADALVLTCPVPQSLDLLKHSRIAAPDHLARITYAPALVALVEDPRSSRDVAGPAGYAAEPGADVHSIADQRRKGVSPGPAWTVTMTPAFSRAHLDDPRALDLILARLKTLDHDFACARAELKTWRFAQPETWGPNLVDEVAPNLLLAGDGFGGPSVNGALRSAAAVIAHLSAQRFDGIKRE